MRLRTKRGDASRFPMQVTQTDPLTGVVGYVDLTSASIALVFTAKHRLEDADPGAFQRTRAAGGIVVTSPLTGHIEVRLVKANTDTLEAPLTLHWDVQMEAVAGEPVTLESGLLHVEPDVTRT